MLDTHHGRIYDNSIYCGLQRRRATLCIARISLLELAQKGRQNSINTLTYQLLISSVGARLDARRVRSLDDMKAAWYGDADAHANRYHHSRYHGLNLNSLFYRGTVEFRYFNGSLHAGEVKSYVLFCLALALLSFAAYRMTARSR